MVENFALFATQTSEIFDRFFSLKSLKFHQNFKNFSVLSQISVKFFWCHRIDFLLKKRKIRKSGGFYRNFCPSGRALRSKIAIFCHFLPLFRFPLQSKGIPHFPSKSTYYPLWIDFFEIFSISELTSSEIEKISKKSIRLAHQNFFYFAWILPSYFNE